MDYILHMIKLEFIKDKAEWYGPDYVKKMWRLLYKHGYRCVKVAVEMHTDGEYYQWPELVELPKQETLFNETLIRRATLYPEE